MNRILHIVGARPNFMKIAPIVREMAKFPQDFQQILVHTGQHYDQNMSQIFFEELELPKPNLNLEVGSGSHAWQTAQVMLKCEPILLEYKPDWVFVPGDVNSTVACALVCSKLGIKIAHVEAGLRSADRSMPEEINRLLTDQMSDLLLTPSRDANENLLREGAPPDKIHFVGNVMIDTLVRLLPKARERWPCLQQKLNIEQFVLVTLHRPSNVDDPVVLTELLLALDDIGRTIPVVFPMHPRTRHHLDKLGIRPQHLILIEPLGYLDFLALEVNAKVVLTDSGGVQEETTYLGIPCLTARQNTERPVTITHGTNRLVSVERRTLCDSVMHALDGWKKPENPPEFWDGAAAQRIVRIFKS